MAQVDYAASLVLSGLLDVSSRGSADCLAAFTDLSGGIRPGQSVAMVEQGALTVNTTDTNAQAAQALSISTNRLIVDQPAWVSVYVPRLDDIIGGNGNFAMQVAEDAYRQLREHVSGVIINLARNNLLGALDTNLIGNAGADALTDADVNAIEALVRKQPGVGRASQLSFVASPGFEAAAKGLLNYQPVTEQIGAGAVQRLNGAPFYSSSALGSSAGDKTVACSAVSIASNVATVTVPAGHGLVRGQLITIAGITTPLTTAAPITATTATTFTVALTAADGAMADGVGTVSTASSLALLFVKPWAAFAFAGEAYEVHAIKSPTGAGWIMQVCATYGVKVRAGGVAAVHAPAV